MTYIILITLYILSIFTCRYVYRLHYKWDLWLKESCGFSVIWLIPIVNTTASILFFLFAFFSRVGEKAKTQKNKKLYKFFNQDL